MAKSAKNSRLRTLKDRIWRDATTGSVLLYFNGVRYVARTFAVGILNGFVSSGASPSAPAAASLLGFEAAVFSRDSDLGDAAAAAADWAFEHLGFCTR